MAAQRASVKSAAAHPRFWGTEDLIRNSRAADFRCPLRSLFQHFRKAAKPTARVSRQQGSCPSVFGLQGAAVSQPGVEGRDPPPRLPARACHPFILCSSAMCSVLFLKDLRVKL